jgi:hypothetical protein
MLHPARSHEEESHVDSHTSRDPAGGHPALVVCLSHNAAEAEAKLELKTSLLLITCIQ